MTNLKTIVRGVGHYLPERIVTNDELAQRVDTSDEWITQRTGIRQRHVAGDNEFTSDLATKAGLKAIEAAGLSPQDIDLIVLATTTPDRTFPAAATTVQKNLGITHGAAFDIQAVCSGFVFAVATADSHLKKRFGQARAGDWRRNVFPALGLGRSHNMCFVWRWRGCDGA